MSYLKSIAIFALCALLASCAATTGGIDTAQTENSAQEKGEKNKEESKEKDACNNSVGMEAALALEAFSNIVHDVDLKVINAPGASTKGRPFSSPFTVSVVRTDGTPQKDFLIAVTYPVSRNDDAIHFDTVEITTGEDGRASFIPDTPKSSFDSIITFTPRLPKNIALDSPEAKESVRMAMSEAQSAAVTAKYQVRTNMAYDGGMIYVWDYGENGKPLVNSAYLLKEIIAYGVTRVGNAPFSSAAQLSKSDDELYRAAKGYVQKGFLIYGTVKYAAPVSTLENGKSYCALIANIKCMDLSTGKLLYATCQHCETYGANKTAAIDACRRELSKIAARAIMYGM